MYRRICAGLFLFSLLIVVGIGRGAQSLAGKSMPVWTMEVIKVKPGMFGPTLGNLDDNWMRIREEAKGTGFVLSYHRIAEQSNPEAARTIVLLTEYKDQGSCDAREFLFSQIRKQLSDNSSGTVKLFRNEDLYVTVSTQVFQDYPKDTHNPQFRPVPD
jgi:hypothetical protein